MIPACLSITSSVLLVLLGVIVSAHPEFTKRHIRVIYGSFAFLALLGILATIFQANDSAEAARQLTYKSQQLSDSLQKVAKSTTEIERITNLNTDLQQRLLTAAADLTRLSNENIKSITGGDGFCYIEVNLFADEMAPIIICPGKYPMYGVTADITDMSLRKKKIAMAAATGRVLSYDEIVRDDVIVNVGDFAPSEAKLLHSLKFSQDSVQEYDVAFSAKNGFWHEEIELRKVNGQWIKAIQTYRQLRRSRKVLYEYISNNFPKVHDKVVWDEPSPPK